MNLILLFDEDFEDDTGGRVARLRGRRRQHVLEIVRATPGDELVVGVLDDRIGRGRVRRLDDEVLELEVELEREAPPKLDVTLVLAVPRPPVMRRVLAAATTIGVACITLLHTRRVEKTYWDARVMQPDALQEAMLLGLEQARDTRFPRLELERRFKPFAEDRLPALARLAKTALVAEPTATRSCPAALETPGLVAVGPEGGFIPFELEAFERAGLAAVKLGERALRVETAVPILLSRLIP